jgi:hypothetical protein
LFAGLAHYSLVAHVFAVSIAALLPGSTDAGAVAGGRRDGMTAVSGIVAALDPGRASCSERRRPWSLGLEAEAALRFSVNHSAEGNFITGGLAGRTELALDIAKNLLWFRLVRCI